MYVYQTLLIPMGNFFLLAIVMNKAAEGETFGSPAEIQYLAQGHVNRAEH